jgi:hypothetical protein
MPSPHINDSVREKERDRGGIIADGEVVRIIGMPNDECFKVR